MPTKIERDKHLQEIIWVGNKGQVYRGLAQGKEKADAIRKAMRNWQQGKLEEMPKEVQLVSRSKPCYCGSGKLFKLCECSRNLGQHREQRGALPKSKPLPKTKSARKRARREREERIKAAMKRSRR